MFIKIVKFLKFFKLRFQMNGLTKDGWTERPSHMDAWTHLKLASFDIQGTVNDP